MPPVTPFATSDLFSPRERSTAYFRYRSNREQRLNANPIMIVIRDTVFKLALQSRHADENSRKDTV